MTNRATIHSQMSAVMQRRGELLAKIAAQRERVAEAGERWQAPLALADQGLSVVRFLRSHPVLVSGVIALIVIRRRGMAGLMKGGWRAWKGYRFFAALSEKLSSQG